MVDGFGGFGLAAKIAMSVPDKNGNAWAQPDGQSSQWRDARVNDGPDTHEFQGSWLSGNRCTYPGCGQGSHVRPIQSTHSLVDSPYIG